MWKNYFKIAVRNLQRRKGYAFINVFGLAVGLACCLLILLLVRHEWSYDRFHEKADRIYRVLIQETRPDGRLDFRALMPPSLAPEMAEAYPGIGKVTRVVKGQLGIRHGNQVVPQNVLMADSTFFELFTFPFLAGDPQTVLDDPQSVILTEEMAENFFDAGPSGYEVVLGRTLTIERGDERHDFTVTGVMASIPDNSSLQFDLVLSFRQYETIPIGSNDWGGRTSLYLLLEEGQAPDALEQALPPFTAVQLADRIEGRREAGYLAEGVEAFQLVLQPLRDLHLSPSMETRYEEEPHNPLYSYILSSIALGVLLIACINFVMLAIGRSTSRAREVGMRKVLGAHRAQLMKQFWGEALLLTALAFALGLVLVTLALPAFNTLTGRELSLTRFIDWNGVAVLAALVALVGLVAGGYPAFVLSRFQPAQVLKGEAVVQGRSRFTRGLVVVQYTISIALIICTLVMYQQLDYLMKKDLGFEGEQVVVVQTPGLTSEQERHVLEVFRNELAGQDDVKSVVQTAYSFTRSYDTFGWTAADGTPFTVHNIGVDFDYLDVLNMELVAGRNFSRDFPSDSTQSVLVNEAFVREYGIEEPVGHVLTGLEDSFFGTNPTIIGVVKDFNFESLHEEVEPAMLNMHPDYYMGMQAMLVKIRPDDVSGTLDRLAQTWKEVLPERSFVYSFLDADMEAQYQAEQRWSQILTYAALLAVFIACLGLFGLATLSVAKRTKEIGIRKVLGASVPGIALLVVKEFVLLVAIAAVLAWPFAYAGMQRWLADFAYRIDMPWWVFLGAGLGALAIALLAVSYQAVKAALTDPVKSLRYE